MELALVLTRSCNLACTYCFAGAKTKDRMGLARALRAIDLGLERARDRGEPLQLAFFGGEPLLEWALVEQLVLEARARAAARGQPISFQMTTNGVLLDDERLGRLTELGVHLALSVDGTRAAHDRHRVTRAGKGTYDQVSGALDRLLTRGLPFDVISVVDPSTLDELSAGVRELLDRGVDHLTLNVNWGAGWSDERLARLAIEYEAIAALWLAWLRRGRAPTIEPLTSACFTLGAGDAFKVMRCDAGAGRLGVGPSGRIYACGRAVGEDDGAGAIGSLDAGLSPRVLEATGACGSACACASAEETGDAREAGRVQRHHEALLGPLARRFLEALAEEPIGAVTFAATFRAEPLALLRAPSSPKISRKQAESSNLVARHAHREGCP